MSKVIKLVWWIKLSRDYNHPKQKNKNGKKNLNKWHPRKKATFSLVSFRVESESAWTISVIAEYLLVSATVFTVIMHDPVHRLNHRSKFWRDQMRTKKFYAF